VSAALSPGQLCLSLAARATRRYRPDGSQGTDDRRIAALNRGGSTMTPGCHRRSTWARHPAAACLACSGSCRAHALSARVPTPRLSSATPQVGAGRARCCARAGRG